MTLIEKFQTITSWWKEAGKCEKIADEFAIDFADWLMKTRFQSIKNIKTEKLLEIYKKEQGL